MQLTIVVDAQILPGSVSSARCRCGKSRCACKADPPQLHGPYYRWTGFVHGKRTTRTLSKEAAAECKRRIRNYRKLLRKMAQLVRESLDNAPWTAEAGRSRRERRRV